MSKQVELIEKEQTSFIVLTNDDHNRVEAHIRGPIIGADGLGEQLTTLYQLSEQYDTLLMYFNTPGGSVATMVEILAAMDKFSTVITIATGQVSSAGFTMWCAGDVRVVQKYSSMMAHRESFEYYGKSNQHADHTTHVDEVYSSMMRDICGSFLTDEEMERAKYTEVFLSGEIMVERGLAISWEQFIQADISQIQATEYLEIDGVYYENMGNNQLGLTLENGDVVIMSMYDVIYGVPNAPQILIRKGEDGVDDEIEVEVE